MRSFVILAGVMLLCFVLGLVGQVGWLVVSRATAPAPEPTPILVPTLLPTQPASAQGPTSTVESTFTPLGNLPTRTPTRGAEPTRTTVTTRGTTPGTTPTRSATATPKSTDEDMVRYVVESGDTLSAISVRFDVSAEEIIEANPGLDPDVIEVGDVILIPRPASTSTSTATPRAGVTRTPQRTATARQGGDEETIEYTIQEGDTLFSISTEFNVTVDAILEANPDLDQDLILAGTVILIPQPEP